MGLAYGFAVGVLLWYFPAETEVVLFNFLLVHCTLGRKFCDTFSAVFCCPNFIGICGSVLALGRKSHSHLIVTIFQVE